MSGQFISSSGGSISGVTVDADSAAIAKAIEVETGDNLVVGKSSIDGRTIIMRSESDNNAITLYESDGVTVVADGSGFEPGGVVSEVIEHYMSTITNGTFASAALMATAGITKMTKLNLYVSTGTVNYTSQGSTFALPSDSRLERETGAAGRYLGSFSLTLDATSTAVVEIEGVV